MASLIWNSKNHMVSLRDVSTLSSNSGSPVMVDTSTSRCAILTKSDGEKVYSMRVVDYSVYQRVLIQQAFGRD